MADKIGVTLIGEKELQQALNQFRGSVQRRIVKKAVDEAAKLVVPRIKEQVQQFDVTGTLLKSIGKVVVGFPKGAGATKPAGSRAAASEKPPIWIAYVGPRTRMGRYVAVNETVSKRGIKKTSYKFATAKATKFTDSTRLIFRWPTRYAHLIERGTKRGVKPKRFMAKGWDKSVRAAQAKMSSEIRSGISKEAAKAAARTAKAKGR